MSGAAATTWWQNDPAAPAAPAQQSAPAPQPAAATPPTATAAPTQDNSWYAGDPVASSPPSAAPPGFAAAPAPPAATAAAPVANPTAPAKSSYLDDVAHTAIQDTTFGLGDKIAAGGYAALNPITGDGSNASTFSQRYAANLATERARDAGESYSATIPGHVLGLAGLVGGSVTGLPEAAGAVTGLNKLASLAAPATDAVGGVVENVLARLPGGTSIVAPIAKGVATNAALGGAVGAADADGGVADHLRGAEQGAIVGGVLGGAGTAAVTAAQPVLRFGRAVYADLGRGGKAAVTDAQGVPLSSPVTGSQADKAAGIIRDFASDPTAVQTSLDAHAAAPTAVPGFHPTSYQVTGDTGLGQLEQGTRANNQQQFIDRANQQNDALVGSVNAKAPAGADSYAVTPAIQAQADATTAAGQAQTASAVAGRDQATASLPTTTDATIDSSGATLRQQVDAQQAPVIQQADAQVQTAQQGAQAATQAFGGTPSTAAGGSQTALQDVGSQFRQTLQDAQQAHLAPVRALYEQLGADGSKALDVSPLKQAAADITTSLPISAKPMGAEEARIHDTIASYPRVQSLQELQALESSIKTEQANQRGPGGDPQAARRLGQLMDGVTDTKAAAIEGAADPAPVAATASSTATPSTGNTVYTPSGQQVGVQYEVAPASSLITSHHDDLSPNPAFPAELQPRDRERAASQAQIASMTNRLQPERLGASTTAADGAPIIGPDGVVESGNARTIAIRRAYQQGGQQAQAYRDFLTAQGHDTAGIDQPVLIRRRTSEMTPEQRIAFTREANGQTTLASSAGEVARSDAKQITPAMLDLHGGGDIAEPANRDLVRSFAKQVVSPQEQGAFATADGQLSRDGAQRIRNAITARAYGDRSLTDALAETGDPKTRVLASALEQAAPDMARVKMGIERGEIDPKVDLAPHVSQALAALRTAREQRIPLADVVKQSDAFSNMSPEALELLHTAYGPNLAGHMSQGDMVEALRQYARSASQQSTESRLFGENLDAGQILSEARARYGRQAETAGSQLPLQEALGSGNLAYGSAERGSVPGSARQTSSGGGRFGRARYGSEALPGAEAPALTPNFTADDAETLRAAHAGFRENKEIFSRAPGVGQALASHPEGRGGFKISDSQVPGRLFSGGPQAAERVQASVRAGIDPDALAHYAALSMRQVAERSDGSLDPAGYAKWMASNREAFDALNRIAPDVSRKFSTAAEASATLAKAQAERAAIDVAHPLKPGWSDADVAMAAVKPGPTGKNRVTKMLQDAGNTDQAKAAVSDVLAHLYQTKVIKGGEVDRNAHDRFVRDYSGALSADPKLAAKFNSVAAAQETVDDAVAAHTKAASDLQKSAARFFLGGGDPTDRIGQALADANRVQNIRDLVRMTENDPNARDGLKRAVVDYMNKNLLAQTTVSAGGERRIQPAGMQKFIREKGAALKHLFSPAEMDGFDKIAEAINTTNQSVQNVRPQGGSDTVYKAIAALNSGGGSTLGAAAKAHAAEAVGGITGVKIGSLFGPAGAMAGGIAGGIGGKVVQSLRQANIKSIDGLVTEAMLNPGLMRVLLSRVTPDNGQSVGKAWIGQLKRLAVMRAAQAVVPQQQ